MMCCHCDVTEKHLVGLCVLLDDMSSQSCIILVPSTHALIMTICTEQQACIDMTSQWVHISLCPH